MQSRLSFHLLQAWYHGIAYLLRFSKIGVQYVVPSRELVLINLSIVRRKDDRAKDHLGSHASYSVNPIKTLGGLRIPGSKYLTYALSVAHRRATIRLP